MYSVQSLDKFKLKEETFAFVIESPITAIRNQEELLKAIGTVIEIDGVSYTPIGFDMFLPTVPVWIGEHIVIVVKSI